MKFYIEFFGDKIQHEVSKQVYEQLEVMLDLFHPDSPYSLTVIDDRAIRAKFRKEERVGIVVFDDKGWVRVIIDDVVRIQTLAKQAHSVLEPWAKERNIRLVWPE